MVKIDDALGDGQTDTGSHGAAPGRIFDLVKRLEYPVEVFRLYADAVVFDLHQQMLTFCLQSNGDVSLIGFSKLDRI